MSEYVEDDYYADNDPYGCVGLLWTARKAKSTEQISSSLVSTAWSLHENDFWDRRLR